MVNHVLSKICGHTLRTRYSESIGEVERVSSVHSTTVVGGMSLISNGLSFRTVVGIICVIWSLKLVVGERVGSND